MGSVPDRPGTKVGEDAPAAEEDDVVHGSQTQVFSRPKLEDVADAELALSLVKAEKLVGAEEGRKRGERLHDDVAADDDGEDQLSEEALDNPWVDRLCAHQELCRQAQLPQEEAEEFDTL